MILNFFLPTACAGCAAPGRDLCDRCAAALANSPAVNRDERGGMPSIAALGAYEGILRSAILALKFRGARSIGAQLGKWLAARIRLPYDGVVGVVPVPLHHDRLMQRGYNQAAEIARGICAELSRAQCLEGAVERIRATAPQSALDLRERRENVDGAFAPGARIQSAHGCPILIVDDVVTTGATVRSCAAVLHSAGARSLSVAAAAVRL